MVGNRLSLEHRHVTGGASYLSIMGGDHHGGGDRADREQGGR